MNRIVECASCGNRFVDNPDKHRFRSKLCPHCLTPYTHSGLKIPFHIRASIEKAIQKVFRFFPEHARKTVVYVCPNRDCNYQADSISKVQLEKFPDKTREVIVDGKPQTLVLTYRDIVTCPECGTHMTRRKKK